MIFSGVQRRAVQAVMIVSLLVALVWSTAEAQDSATSPATAKSVEAPVPAESELSLDELKAKRAEVEGSKELGESVKKSVLSLLDQAIRFRERVDQLRREAEEIAQRVKTAPQRIKDIEAELDRPIPSPDTLEDFATASEMETGKLEERVRREEADLANAKTALSVWTDQLDEQKNRPQQLRENIATVKLRLEKLREELNYPASPEEPTQLTQARRLSLLAEQAKCQAEIKSYEEQRVGQDVLVSLLTAEHDLATREMTRREALTRAWQAKAQKRREQEAMKAREEAEEAKEQAATSQPLVQEQFDINIALGQELETLTQEEAALTERLEGKQAQLTELEEEFALSRERVKNTVLTKAIGLALSEQRQSLPSLRGYRRDSAQRQLKMSEIREAQFRVDRERRDLADLDAETDRLIQSLGSVSEAERASLKKEVRRLLSDRRALFEKLQAGYHRFFKNLQNLEFTEQQLVTKAEEYAEFLDGHLLWIRSSKIIGPADLRNVGPALAWVASPGHWWQVIQDLRASFARSAALWVLGLLVGVALVAGRRSARRDIASVAKGAGRVRKDSFGLTLRALVMTICLAAGWPFLMAFVGGRLLALPFARDFSRSVGGGLIVAALVLASIGFVFHLCRNNGLAQVHFKWSEPARLTLRRNLLWLVSLVAPLGFLIWAIEVENNIVYRDSLGRLAFIAAMIGLSMFAVRVLRFSGGIVSTLLKRRPNSWLARLRYIWYPLAVGVPLVLALLDAMGYYYTALTLERRVDSTALLVIGLIVANDLVLRWLFIAQRRLVFEEAKRKQEAPREPEHALKADEQTSEAGVDGQPIPIEEPEVGLVQIDEQTRALLRAVMLFSALLGLWAIWAPVLPALNVMGDVHLWSYSTEVDGVTKTLPITLANLVMAIVVVAISIVAARNLPGVLEITLLRRLPMDPGARYAFTTICRYAITAAGIVAAFSTIGFRWSSLQWLIAALGVGLGFGLQEIVANFVCGLIVLFERPYRVGDVVTVGGTSGTVTRIRIRATTITDFDRHELIVPNKEFITGKLVNWSLSDPITRITVPVGIAYGSDTVLAERLLMKVAQENPMVLDQPEPAALFLGFGDNSLNFELRVFIGTVQNRFPTIHQLHQAIDREFRQAGITIAFPQRDVHLDAGGPLDVRVVSDQDFSQRPLPESESVESEE